MKFYEHLITTSTGGIIVTLLTTPLDVIKVRLIAQTLPSHTSLPHHREVYSGALDAAFKISRHEGFTALWNGVGATLLQMLPATMLYFTTFDMLREKGRAKLPDKYHHLVPSLAGITAKSVNIGVFSPVELVRTKIQSEQQLSYSKIKDAVKTHIRNNGIKSLWDGAKSQFFKDIPFTVVYWYFQDMFKIKLKKRNYGTLSSNCGGAFVAGAVAAIVSHPFDVTKTQLQSNVGLNSSYGRTGMVRQMIHISKTRGVTGLYAGLAPRMIKVLPASMIYITAFEGLKEYFNSKNDG